MPELRVEVDPDVAEALATETSLLGFDSEEAYLAWIVENRAAIEQGTESAELLANYRDRLAALEARLSDAGVDPGDVDGEPVLESVVEGRTAELEHAGRVEAQQDGAETQADGTEPEAAPTDGTERPGNSPTPGGRSGADAETANAAGDGSTTSESSSDDSQTTSDGAQTTFSADDLVRGSASDGASDAASHSEDATSNVENATPANGPTADVDGAGAASEAGGDDAAQPATASDGGTAAAADVTSMHLRPERVRRINEDPVARDAGELQNVEVDRVDELSRRAVAETRKRLDRDVETGLEYDSSATISEDVRPGEDLADLDAIDVPGRSSEVVAERRAVVGRALALLRDEGRARRSAFVEALYGDHPAGYETPDGWWRCVREGLGQVDAVDGGHVWTYED